MVKTKNYNEREKKKRKSKGNTNVNNKSKFKILKPLIGITFLLQNQRIVKTFFRCYIFNNRV